MQDAAERIPALPAAVALLALCAAVAAASLHGTVFDENLTPSSRALVQIDTVPQQQLITFNGSYAFDVPAGTYRLIAVAANASAEKNITIASNGDFRLDMVLLPGLPNDELAAINDLLSAPQVTPPAETEPPGQIPWLPLFGILALAAVATLAYSQRHRLVKPPAAPKNEPSQPKPAPSTPSGGILTADQHKVMQTLESFNNRAPQKDLRKALNQWSEAKVSMELTELEDKGVIQKIKKGRGNVIRRA